MKRYLGAMAFGLVTILLSGCAMAEPIKSGEHPPVKLSAWMASWDADSGKKEYGKVKKRLDAVSCFAVCYDEKDELLVPKEIRDMLKVSRKGSEAIVRYLSFVNDSVTADGKTKEKDTDLLKRLLADDAFMEAQAGKMVSLAKELGCEGVELDYEKEWKDEAVFRNYVRFTSLLFSACSEQGLKLRIILEPSAPMDAPYCEGPEYVVMLYNLYGKHSGPGPKADGEFIGKTVRKMESLPGEKSVAIATGGCLWEKGGFLLSSYDKKKFLTEKEAVDLCKKHKAEAERDPGSACLHFSYKENGKTTEVWYADSETLSAWITVAANAGVGHVALWRLGGNTDIEKACKHKD